MSMEKKRPQLNHDELLQLRWMLGGIAALTGAWAVAFLDAGAEWLLGVCTAAVLLVLWKPALPARVPGWIHRLAFPAILAFAVFDFYAQGEVLTVMTRLALLLLTYRAISYRRRRDELQLVVLGLFLVVVAGVLTVSMGFAVQIMAFTGLALAMLMAMTLSEAAGVHAEAGRAPVWAERVEWRRLFKKLRAVADWRILTLGGFLFLGVAVVSGLLFMAIPRFELRNSLFLEGLMKRKSSSGFTDTMRFGDVSEIMKDESVAMRVEVGDRALLPAELYWRMVVMDEYREQSFRLSAGLRASAFERARTVPALPGEEPPSRGAVSWTFYVEAGTGRYLPLTGGFERLSFTEPQSVRMSSSLRLIELTREPMAMKAYRVRGMTGRETLGDREFAGWLRLGEDGRRAKSPNRPTMLEIGLGEADRAQLERVVAEITGGVELPAAEFARKAQAWLGERHGYTLSPAIPEGSGDPLVRWLVSREAGHCELFAGAFTLLARVAGHPARVVGGFVGGTWNKDHIEVRNSNAHAWCEIFDGAESWGRVDPTMAAGGGDEQSAFDALTGGAALRDGEGGWTAAMDRLRLFWYRRIVNFDQSDQQVLREALKESAQDAGKNFKAFAEQALAWVKSWLTRPWSGGRIGWVAGAGAGLGLLWLAWRRKGRAWWLNWRSERGGGMDPVRREAGRWLRRLNGLRGGAPEAGGEAAELRTVHAELWSAGELAGYGGALAEGAEARAAAGARVSAAGRADPTGWLAVS
jgi:transglutaminase-like putative cysteine protease